MSDQFEMFSLETCEASPVATSLPASASGTTRSGARGGRKTVTSGPQAVPANHSPAQESVKRKRTKGIFGQSSFHSSPHEDLSFSLASRLRAVTDSHGSTMYDLTWETVTTPMGFVLPRLAATARRTEESGCTSWPSPMAQQANGEPEAFLERKRRSVERGSQMGVSLTDLQMVAKLATWPSRRTSDTNGSGEHGDGGIDLRTCATLAEPWASPAARDWRDGRASQETMDRNSRPLNEQAVMLTAWSTPNVPNGGRTLSEEAVINRGQTENGKRQVGLENEAKLTAWASPQARDHFPAHTEEYIAAKKAEGHGMANLNDEARLTASGETQHGSTAETKSIGQLNARHSAWMMGLPEIWDVSAWAVQKTRKLGSRIRSKKTESSESCDSVDTGME